MKIPAFLVLAYLMSSVALSADSVEIFKKQCGEGLAANEYPAWQRLEFNAIRTADEFVTKRNPSAFFVRPQVSVIFQAAGPDAGKYHVHLLQRGTSGISLAILRPNFPFCIDPKGLDDSRKDLFSVVLAKLNGKPL